jgi:hypothetical protein
VTDVREALGAQRLAGELRRHRHVWDPPPQAAMEDGDYAWRCRCGVIRDEAKSRAGTSARRLGHDQERRIERVYGPRKVGEFGDAIDLLGRDFMWQSKSTRGRTMPVIQADMWALGGVPGYVGDPIQAMLALRQDKMPLLIRSWVRNGLPTVDVIYVRAFDWQAFYGKVPQSWGYVAMTGQHFLDVHGRDTP